VSSVRTRTHRLAWEVGAWLLLALALVEWWQRLFRGGVETYSNADILYLATLVEDVVVRGHPFAGAWHLTPAPYLFPDGLFTLLARALSPRIELVQVGTVVLQVLAAAFAARAFLAAVTPDEDGAAALGPAVVACGVALGLHGQSTFDLFVHPAYHTGVVTVTLAAGALIVAPAGRRWWPRAVAVAALCLLGGASDSLVVLWGLVLGVVAGGVAVSARRRQRAPAVEWSALRLSFVAAGASLAAFVARRVALPFPDKTHDRLRLARVPATLAQAWVDWGGYGAALQAVLPLGLVLLAALAARGRTPHLRFAAGVSLAFAVAVLASIIATGFLNDAGWYRYLLTPSVLGLCAVAWCAPRPSAKGALTAVVGAVVLSALTPRQWVWGAPLPDFRVRPQVACVDALADREGAHVVLTDYWVAKPLTLLSARGVRAAQLTPEVDAPYLWITSRAWYGPFDEAGLVVTSGLDEAAVDARFGAPAEVVTCGDWRVRVYRGDGRAAVRRFLDDAVTRAIGPVPR